jgi:hypothetical protein
MPCLAIIDIKNFSVIEISGTLALGCGSNSLEMKISTFIF